MAEQLLSLSNQCMFRLHCCVHLHVVDTDVSRNGTDEADQLLVRVNPHPTMPLGQPARGPQGPEKDKSQSLNATLCCISIISMFCICISLNDFSKCKIGIISVLRRITRAGIRGSSQIGTYCRHLQHNSH